MRRPFALALLALLAGGLMTVRADAQGQPPAPAQPPAPGAPGGQPPAGQPPAGQPQTPDPGTPPAPRTAPAQTPPRAFRGLFGGPRTVDPTRTRTELTFSANGSAGYDDNVAAGEGGGGGAVPSSATSGFVADGDVSLDYFYGNGTRSVRVQGAGTVQAMPDYLDSVAPGASMNVAAATALGRRQTLTASQFVAWEPLFTFGQTFIGGDSAAPPPVQPAPGVPVTSGLFERRSFSSGSNVALDRRWSRRDTTQLAYGYSQAIYTSDEGGDTRTHNVSAGYSRALSRRWAARAGYAYSHGTFDDLTGVDRPTRQHMIEGGPEYNRRLSPTRTVAVSAAGGASRIESQRADNDELYAYWAPFASLAATLSLSESWSLGSTYRRGLSTLDGLTGQSYYSDSASVSVGGLLTSRTDLTITGNATAGRTAAVSGSDSDYRVYGASSQFSFALTRTIAATATYSYYYHRYSNPEDLPVGFPPQYDRNSVRVGLTMWVPLRGTFAGR